MQSTGHDQLGNYMSDFYKHTKKKKRGFNQTLGCHQWTEWHNGTSNILRSNMLYELVNAFTEKLHCGVNFLLEWKWNYAVFGNGG